MSFENYRQGYTKLYNSLKIRPDYVDDLDLVRRKILNQKSIYTGVAAKFNIPWIWFAVTHWRECSLNPKNQILNGQRWDRTTTIVPKGRGPYSNWEEAAIDGVLYHGLHKVKDWSLERCLYELERWNGFGPRKRGMNTYYLWCGSQHYTKGGWPRDHVFDSNYVNKALGCAVIIKHFDRLGIDTGIKGLATVMKQDVKPSEPIVEIKEPQKVEVKATPKNRLPSWLSRFLRKIKVL